MILSLILKGLLAMFRKFVYEGSPTLDFPSLIYFESVIQIFVLIIT